MTVSDGHAKIVSRIRKLMQITSDKGASEAEAMTAAAMAGDLLAQHKLTKSEIDLAATSFGSVEAVYGGHRSENLMRVCQAIAKLTDTIGWSREGVIGYFGAPIDCELAHYLTTICRDAMDGATSAYEPQDEAAKVVDQPRGDRQNSFQRGMADRQQHRIIEIHEDRLARERSASRDNALIILKGQLVQENFAKSGMKLTPYMKKGSVIEYQDYAAGQEAGTRVVISKPIRSDTPAS